MLKEKLNILGAFITDKLRKELLDQGHKNTGALMDSIRYEVKASGNNVELIFYAKGYSKFVEYGFGPGKWVNPFALAEWVEQKGIATGEKEIKSAAFAIRQNIFKQGMPTDNAYKFSTNGRRTGYIQAVIDENGKVIIDKLFKIFTESFIFTLSDAIKKSNNVFTRA